jgi:hypothetical protein
MSSYFLRNGNTFRISAKEAMDLHEKLPVGNYIIKEDQFGNLFLEMIDSFERPKKLYGDTERNTERMIRTFLSRSTSTGIMLAGEKGSGKSLLAKNLSLACAEQDIPTIVINAPWKGDKFNKFLQDIEQHCVILFDEFEKVYDREDQESILTLLDGVFPSKKLFVLTCNDKWRIDGHMRNRPGRIFYMLDFKGLGVDFIAEYCQDTLENKEHIDQICRISSLFGEFNFDMLKALVEEMNRYNESPQDALRMLNAKPEFDSGSEYKIAMTHNGKPVENPDPTEWSGNPLNPKGFWCGYDADPSSDDDDTWKNFKFEPKDLTLVEPANGRFVFENAEKVKLVLTKAKEEKFNYYAF